MLYQLSYVRAPAILAAQETGPAGISAFEDVEPDGRTAPLQVIHGAPDTPSRASGTI